MTASYRSGQGFVAGSMIGALGGPIGLGGAELRLPVLVGLFKLPTLEAVILNKAMSLVVVTSALAFRAVVIPFEQQLLHGEVTLNLLTGSLIGAWWAAGHAMTMSRVWLDRIIMVLLAGLGFLMLSEGWFDGHNTAAPLFETLYLQWLFGLLAGFGIGIVAALLGVAGGELLIPTIVLPYGLDIKLAGSLSLTVSLPTMIVGFARYSQSDAFAILRHEQALFRWMVASSILGAAVGGLLVGLMSTSLLMTLLGAILLISAIKTFKHKH